MEFSETLLNGLPKVVADLIKEESTPGLSRLLASLLGAYRTIGEEMRAGGYSSNQVGTQNVFGDNQLDVDVKTDAIMFTGLYFNT